MRSEVIRKELEISGIQDVRSEHKQNWINHLVEWTTPDSRNTPSTTNLEEEEIVDTPGNDGKALMPEQVKRPNTWRKMMMMMMMMILTEIFSKDVLMILCLTPKYSSQLEVYAVFFVDTHGPTYIANSAMQNCKCLSKGTIRTSVS